MGRNIEKKGILGKADPYVKLTLGKQKAKSLTVTNNYNPEWNFISTFDVNRKTSENIIIEVFDEDLGKDDALGSTFLDVTSIQKQKHLIHQWISLENCKSGEILLSAEFVPIGTSKEQNDVKEVTVTEPIKESVKEIDTKSKIEIEENVIEPVIKITPIHESQQQKVLEKGQLV